MGNDVTHHDTGAESKPTLYVVATPIGNLQDITLRALDVLKRVDVIAAEDTRVAARLLTHFGIAGRLLSLHEHNESRALRKVLAELAAGRSVALVSDAGTPTVSDPGAAVVAAVREAGFHVSPLPGANAAVAALSVSGLAAPHFLFYGFLPAQRGARQRALAALARAPHTLVFYEAPHRIAECARDLGEQLGGARRAVVARELTKVYEEIHACPLGALGEWIDADPNRRRGEFVLIVEGAPAGRRDAGSSDAHAVLETLLEALPVKQAVALAVKLTGGRKNEIYALALRIKSGGDEAQ